MERVATLNRNIVRSVFTQLQLVVRDGITSSHIICQGHCLSVVFAVSVVSVVSVACDDVNTCDTQHNGQIE